MFQPPCSISPTPPGSCMTPSSVTNSEITTFRMFVLLALPIIKHFTSPYDIERLQAVQVRSARTAPGARPIDRCLDDVLGRENNLSPPIGGCRVRYPQPRRFGYSTAGPVSANGA